jgi:hypothetical protein
MPADQARSPLRATWMALAILPALVGCAKSPKILFLEHQHVDAYSFTQQDLDRLQFYASSEVVAQDMDAPPGAEGVVLMNAGTPGVAVASGHGWIRVRFQQGYEGAVFLADPTAQGDTGYALATEDGGGGYSLVRNDDDRILRLGGRRYRVAIGAHSSLLVDRDQLKKLIDSRPHVQGQRVQPQQ